MVLVFFKVGVRRVVLYGERGKVIEDGWEEVEVGWE